MPPTEITFDDAAGYWTVAPVSPEEVVPPVWFTFVKQPLAVVQAGSPNFLLNAPRSLSAVGWSYAITIAIVCPAPAVRLVEKP